MVAKTTLKDHERSVPSLRVVIAEDEGLVAVALRRMLENLGHQVVGEASNGREAVNMVKAIRPDLVIMDIRMPEVDGIEASRQINEAVPSPIIILSAYGDQELVAEASEAGVGAYLVKPLLEENLVRAITVAKARFDELMGVRQLQQEAEANARHLGTLNVVAMLVNQSLNLQSITKIALDKVLELMHLDCGVIFLLNEREKTLSGITFRGVPSQFIHAIECTIPKVKKDVDEILSQSNQVWISTDISQATDMPPQIMQILREEGVQAFVAIPLNSKERFLGLMALGHRTKRHFNQPELRVLQAIAGQIGVGVENAQLHERLARSEERYRSLAENSLHGIGISQRGKVVYVNKAWLRMFGYEKVEEVLNRNIWKFMVPESLPYLRNMVKQWKRDNPLSDIEYKGLRKDGTTFDLKSNIVSIELEGKPAILFNFQDVTRQKRAEEARRESEARFRRLAENAPDIIYRYQLVPKKQFEYVSPAATAITGYPPEEYYADPELAFKIVHPEDRSLLQSIFQSKDSFGRAIVLRWIRKDGEVIWIEQRNVPICDDKGNLIAIEGIVRDITERKRMEQELRQWNEELTTLNAIATTMSRSLDLHEILQNVLNKISESIGAAIGSIFLWDSSSESFERIASVGVPQGFMEMTNRFTLDSRIVKKYSKTAKQILRLDQIPEISQWLMPLRQKYGLKDSLVIPLMLREKLVGCIVLSSKAEHFFTKRMLSLLESIANQVSIAIENARLFKTVMQAKVEWERTFDSITDFISILDTDFHILKVNAALSQALNVESRELIGRYCYEVFHCKESPWPACPHAQTLQTQKAALAEVEEPRLGGTFLISTSPLFDARGELVGSVHIAKDITERKRLQQQLIQSDKLSALGQMISGVAHELNNPLSGVVGLASLLIEEEEVDERMRKDLETITQAGQRCQKIIQNLLAFARKHKPYKALININQVIESVLELKTYELKVDNIELNQQLDPGLPVIMGDYYQLQQVFLNLINNAHQAMIADKKRRGKLTVITEAEGDVIRAKVMDTGPGISKEDQDKIFDPFFTTKEVGEGTGLGLSICYGIIEKHGGQIYLESSRDDQGATFVVELPVRKEDENRFQIETIVPEKSGITPGSKRILVVDDEEIVVNLLYRVLRKDGHQVDIARNGRRALEKIGTNNYELVISDLKMPDLDGKTLFKEICEHHPELKTKMIFITGDISSDTEIFLEQAGNIYLKKPFTVEAIREVINKATE